MRPIGPVGRSTPDMAMRRTNTSASFPTLLPVVLGALSIWGLRRDIDKHVAEGESNQEITVKGWVQEIYEAPPCPEGGCPPPKQPHVWITDQEGVEGKKRAMMVVNYRMQIPEWQAK